MTHRRRIEGPGKQAYLRAAAVSAQLLQDYEQKNKAFLDEQAGIIASRLEEGIPCPVCGKPMSYPLWVKQSGSKKITLCHCEDHGDYMVRVQFFKGAGGVLKVCKTLYRATDEVRAYYNEKYEAFISRDPSLAQDGEDKPKRRRRRHRGGRKRKKETDAAENPEVQVVETVSE